MKKKVKVGWIGMFMISTLYLSSCNQEKDEQANSLPTTGVTYYVDATAGDDGNKGTSSDKAWKSLQKVNAQTFKAGDSILFKSGESWQGQLLLKGSGVKKAPIVISSYGNGSKPLIDGQGDVDHVIRLEDVSYWEIYNLEITNPAVEQGSRIGVFITANGGQQQHIYLKNLYIHDIFGNYSFETVGKNTGGIGIIGKGDARFDDILIEGCEIGNIVRVGIFTNGNTGKRGDRPITNLVIRNNKIHHCAGDGAIIRYADKPLIEYNEAYENHNGPEELVKYGVALWCRSTDEAVFQYNEVYNTRGSMDGQAFDADLDAYRTVVQYNYSHDNEGGFMLVYGTSSDAIVRYNLSINDGQKGKHIFDFPVWKSPRGSGIFHNNTIYLPEGNDAVIADEALETAHFYNNIFYNEDGGNLAVRSENQTADFTNNAYFGYSKADLALDSDPLVGDLQLQAPGNEGDQLSGYKLTKGSPCIDQGLGKAAMEGNYWLPDLGETDFWGNPIEEAHMDIGAHQPAF